MTIALLTDGIPPYVQGGMQKHSFLLTEYLARNGVQVLLYHFVKPSDSVSNDQVKLHFSEVARRHIEVRTFTYQDSGWLPGHYLRAQKALSKLYFHGLKQETVKINFIYAKGFTGWTCLERRAEIPNCAIGVKFHGMNMFQAQPDWKGELSKFLLRRPVRSIMRQADYVFSYGGKVTDIIQEEVKGQTEIIEIPAGIHAASVKKSSPSVRVGNLTRFVFVGRYDRLKGLPELYHVLKQLDRPDWHFTFIGPIPEGDQLQHPQCLYTGAIYEEQRLFEQLDTQDVLVCPSISEGMPNVILEAMARGLAIIATDVGATSILVKDNGRLIQAKNTDQLQKVLHDYMEMDARRLMEQKMTSIARIQEKFTWEYIVQQLLEFLKSV